ncbi:MAG: sulfatase-like hydrolase/transferase [Bacteroidota bacterium]
MKSTALWLLCLLSLCTACQTESTPQDPELPNVILLVGDDQGYPYFGFMGADYVQTPNMDSLAASGLVFDNGYVSDNHCRPSLQTLLTGLLPIDYHQKSDSILQDLIAAKDISEDSLFVFKRAFDQKALAFSHFNTLPKLLAEKGYVSFQGGKWWEFSYQNGGFTHGMTKGWTQEDLKNPDWFTKHMGGEGMDLARVSNQAAYDFLSSTRGTPFFMWFAPSLPHYPFDAPEKYYQLYADKEMTESAKRYYANCTWFDETWGEMVQYLKDNDLYDNTLIIYVNDNGWEQAPDQEFWDDPMRSHNGGDKGKSSIYDMSFRSPIVFAWPGQIEEGRRSEALIHSADIPATILDYVGIEVPTNYFGQSYRLLIEGNRSEKRKNIIGNVINTRSDDPNEVMGKSTEGYWIREGHWFLRWDLTRGEKELFDLRTDVLNDHNVAEAYPEVFAAMMEQLVQYKEEKGEDPRLSYYRQLKGK